MKRLKRVRILVFVIVTVLLLQIGFVAYSMLGINAAEKQVAVESTVNTGNNTPQIPEKALNSEGQLSDNMSTEISQEILDIIKESDPEKYTRNVENYKKLLKDLNVHIKFKDEIERLVKAGRKLPDVLTAYAFLNDNYGKMGDIQKLVKEKESGKNWADIFKEYYRNNPEFVPESFNSQYLEGILKTPGITQDDIMLGDRIAQKVKKPFEEIIKKKISGMTWRAINAELEIVNGQEKIPHVPVTREQLKKYSQNSKLTEKQIVEALVMAGKLGENGDKVINMVNQGLASEEIYASAYKTRYY